MLLVFYLFTAENGYKTHILPRLAIKSQTPTATQVRITNWLGSPTAPTNPPAEAQVETPQLSTRPNRGVLVALVQTRPIKLRLRGKAWGRQTCHGCSKDFRICLSGLLEIPAWPQSTALFLKYVVA